MDTPCLFGAIADDYTGGSDLAGMLRQGGARTLLLFETPPASALGELRGRFHAAVICLKTRSMDPLEACSRSSEAADALRSLGARQIQFKYCSTFDSTPAGNIGPVAATLLRTLDVPWTVAVPALPVNGRTQYFGHLFVNGQPLSESRMRHHPLNPMTDSNLVRWLARQTEERVGLIDVHALRGGRFDPGAARMVLVDAIDDGDLRLIAERCVDMPLLTGGSGLGMMLPEVWARRGELSTATVTQPAPVEPSGTLILAGSCSAATLEQLRVLEASGCPMRRLRTGDLARDVDGAAEWAADTLRASGVACVLSSAAKADRVDRPGLGEEIERALAAIALHAGARRIVVAGGETSGAVVKALAVGAAEVLSVIDPGVPALQTLGGRPIRLALKSGNFGASDFFMKAVRALE